MRLRDLQAAASICLVLMGSGVKQGLAQHDQAPEKWPGSDAPAATEPVQPKPAASVSSGATEPGPGAPAASNAAPSAAASSPATAPAPAQEGPVVSSSATPAPPLNASLPQEPAPKLTEPLFLRDTTRDYTKPKSHFYNPLAPYTATSVPLPRLANTAQLDSLLRDGKMYLSLSDAIALALENNFDIAIARINLDIADTDLLRARAGSSLRGVSTGLVQNTLGGTTSTVTGGGGPGGTSSGSGGGGSGSSGLVLSTNGGGPTPEFLDPVLTGQLEYEAVDQEQSNLTFSGGQKTLYTNTSTYNFGYTQGFLTGTQLAVTFDNARVSTNNPLTTYSPQITPSFRATATQHLLQGFGPGVNGRFILQAKNDRRITDSAFRQQVLYTVNQIENIYWGLVSAYEDVQAKDRALAQSKQLTADNRKQLEIGTLAPLDVVNSDSTVASDTQALISSKSNLEYQQLIMKQAIARDLTDPALSSAPVIPSDRVGLDRLPEEDMPVEDLVKQAYVNNPQIEQAVLNMKNNEITIRAEKNGLLPIVDAYAFYGASALAGSQNPHETNIFGQGAVTPVSPVSYPTAFGNLFNSTAPDKGVGVNITIPIRNRTAQADQARSQMEYRQSQMRLQQLYTQIRIQVINAQYALTNDRAQVTAAQAAHDFAEQSLDAEQKKYRLGASTTAAVLQQGRNLATAENNLIAGTAAYAKDRASLKQLLSTTLDQYGISIEAAATGDIKQAPVIPGLTAPKAPEVPKPIGATPVPPPS